MLFTWRKPDYVARPNFLDRPALALRPSAAGRHDQSLTEGMRMPRGSCSGLDGASNNGSIRTVPVNQSVGPLPDGREPTRLISILTPESWRKMFRLKRTIAGWASGAREFNSPRCHKEPAAVKSGGLRSPLCIGYVEVTSDGDSAVCLVPVIGVADWRVFSHECTAESNRFNELSAPSCSVLMTRS